MAAEISKYAMESAYKDVERYELGRTEAREQPKAIMLGGQAGSGKSALRAEAVRELRPSGGAVVIDADRMREENPRYKQLSIEDPQHAADRTHKEAGEWSVRLTMAAIEARRNVVVDGSMRNPEHIKELADRFKENGYAVEARVLAVNPETSMARARLRFEEQVVERGTGRFVNQEQHDNAYRGIQATVRALEQDKLVDTVRLYDANQRPIYDNHAERGEWQKPAAAAVALEQERTRAWTHAEQRDYVSVLQEILTLAKQREGIQDNVTYTLGSAKHAEAQQYQTAHEAAQAFRDAPPQDLPHVTRVEQLPHGGTAATPVAQTRSTQHDGQGEYEKRTGGHDETFRQAYADAMKPAQERERKLIIPDRDQLEVKLAAARTDLARFEHSATYARAKDFDQLSRLEALERHPELDGAYKQLDAVKQSWKETAGSSEHEITHADTRAALSEQLHRGHIPQGQVSLEESQHAIDSAAAYRGLMVRDADMLKRDVRGEVIAESSQHTLVKMSDMIAVRFEKDKLDRDMPVGERVAVQYAPGKSVAHEQGQEPGRDQVRNVGRDLGR